MSRSKSTYTLRLRAFPVPGFADVIPEGFDRVEKGFITEPDFASSRHQRRMLNTRNNPDCSKGTVVEQPVATELRLERASPAATA